MKDKINIQTAVQNLDTRLNKAYRQFEEWHMYGELWMEPSWLIESCFLQLLAIAEVLDLPELRRMTYKEYAAIKSAKTGFNKVVRDEDGEPHSPVIARMRCYLASLENLFPCDSNTTVTKDLLQIIRDVHYVITDTGVFSDTPANENDVHLRIEAILKCVFPDLKHKPTLTKQIKNFVPDTGIPSLKTLVEYKFLSRKRDIGPIADEVLADTRGYTSKDWARFLYVIYETNRFRTEKDWAQFLQESGVPNNTAIVVLGGEPYVQKKAIRKRKAKDK